MLKIKYLLFVLVAFFALTACSNNKEHTSDSWQEEVLFASECGLDGLQCCVNEETLCLYEQECCVDPNDSNSTYCADTCNFGEENTFCREFDPKCNTGSVCFKGYCQLAGGNKQPCFLDESCSDGFVCGDGICVECGLAGNPCCESELECINKDKLDNSRTECVFGSCVECGYASKPACQTEPACNLGHLKNNISCLLCGSYNQPCCRSIDDGSLFCDNEKNLTCQSGFCL